MKFTRCMAAVCAFAFAAATYSPPAQAGDSDALVAGAAGLAVGTLLGSAVSRPRPLRYYPGRVYVTPPPPPPVVYRPAPVYYGPAPWTPEWYAYCARKYDSFHAPSGTFLGYDGFRHTCI